jgi:hypothetical protein
MKALNNSLGSEFRLEFRFRLIASKMKLLLQLLLSNCALAIVIHHLLFESLHLLVAQTLLQTNHLD